MATHPTNRYGSDLIRPAFLPGLVASAACVAGLWASGTDWMLTVLFVVSIFAAITAYFCFQALRLPPRPASRTRPADRDGRPVSAVFMILTIAVVVIYNPVFPLVLSASGTAWQLIQVFCGAIVFAAGVVVKTRSRAE